MLTDFERYADEVRSELIPWPEPVPFDTQQLPAFPTEVLPGPLAAFVWHLSEFTQTDMGMAGALALGILSTALQSQFDVRIKRGWSEPLCLYVCTIAAPGERKSAVLKSLLRPIFAFERERRELEAADLEWSRTEREMLEQKLLAAKKKGDMELAREISDELAAFKEMHPFRLLASDCTPEKLIDLMEKAGGSLTLQSAEGGSIVSALRGRYDRNSGLLDILLCAHAGDAVTVDRIGRASNFLPDPRLSLMLCLQPSALQGLTDDADYRGRGLPARFLFVRCESRLGYREIDPEEIPYKVTSAYQDFVRRILPRERGERQVITLSPEAAEVFRRYRGACEKRLVGAWDFMPDWASKLPGATARLAALIHASDTDDPAGTPISGITMESAVMLGEYFSAHAAGVFRGTDTDFADARYLWGKLKGRGEIGRQELWQMTRGRLKTADALSAALDTLEAMGYVRQSANTTGGRPLQMIATNPLSGE